MLNWFVYFKTSIQMKDAFKKVNQTYYLIFTLTILFTIIGYFFVLNNFSSTVSTGFVTTILEVLLVLYIVVSSIAGFVLFNSSKKKLRNIENEKDRFFPYIKSANLRLYLIGVGLLAGILIFYVLRSSFILYCIAVSAIELIVCKPSEERIKTDLDLKNSD